jgi:dolichyl-phosphate-mannose-protein mannosyltransferase
MKSNPKVLFSTKISWSIFSAFLIVRLGFIYLSGYDSFQLLSDTTRYNIQSDNILHGNYNLTEPLFITAPLYPYFEALFKLTFSQYWIPALQITQIILLSLSGVYLYKTAGLIWKQTNVPLLATLIYCFFPLTFWWVHTFSQETLFQSLLIFTIYLLLKAVNENSFSLLIASACSFSLTFLTKSHILLFSPFIPIIILLSKNNNIKGKISYILTFTGICLGFTLPYGLYNLRVNAQYVLSSTGLGTHFLLGHNEDAYLTIVNAPPRDSAEGQRLSRGDFYILKELLPQVQGMPDAQKQRLFFNQGIKWIKENPKKALTLAVYDFFRFLMPGVNGNWYPVKEWLLSLLISLPIYLFGYIGIALALKQDFYNHFWIAALFLSMTIFSVGFYVQNRFRTITIEPFYILYAAFFLNYLGDRIREKYIPPSP